MKKYISFILIFIISLGIIVCKDEKSRITAQDKNKTETQKKNAEKQPEKKVTPVKKGPDKKKPVKKKSKKRYRKRRSGLRGRIIDITRQFLVIKRGRWEKKIYFSDNVVVVNVENKETDMAALDICQQVTVYTGIKDKIRYAKRIKIRKEGDCLE